LLVGVFSPRSVSLGRTQCQRCDNKNCFHNRPLCVSDLWQRPEFADVPAARRPAATDRRASGEGGLGTSRLVGR
jgi:hypothetical protein